MKLKTLKLVPGDRVLIEDNDKQTVLSFQMPINGTISVLAEDSSKPVEPPVEPPIEPPVEPPQFDFYEDFEANSLNPDRWKADGSLATLETQWYNGDQRGYESYIPIIDAPYKNTRQEIQYNIHGGNVPRYQPFRETRTIMFSLYTFEDWHPDPVMEVVCQLAVDASNGFSPGLLKIEGDEFQWERRTMSEENHTDGDPKGILTKNLYPVLPGRKHYIAIQTCIDPNEGGLGHQKIWISNDEWPTSAMNPVFEYYGPTGYYNGYHKHKIGLYKPRWNRESEVQKSKAAGVTHRSYVHDDFAIINGPLP